MRVRSKSRERDTRRVREERFVREMLKFERDMTVRDLCGR